jgi:hypothetical protein
LPIFIKLMKYKLLLMSFKKSLFVLLLITSYSSFIYSSPFFTIHTSSSPEEINQEITLFFGEKLTSEKFAIGKLNEYSWTIQNDSLKIEGHGDEIYNYTFETPGNYLVTLSPNVTIPHNHNEECNHISSVKILKINILPYRIEFQFDKTNFSKDLKADIDVSGTTLTIPSTIFLYGIQNINLNQLTIVASGINTNIIGEIVDKEKIYLSGKNKLTFSLSGKASANTYIMFDIYNAEKLISTYYYPNKITN